MSLLSAHRGLATAQDRSGDSLGVISSCSPGVLGVMMIWIATRKRATSILAVIDLPLPQIADAATVGGGGRRRRQCR